VPEFKLRYLSKREAREAAGAISKRLGRSLTPMAEVDSEGTAIIVTEEGVLLVGVPDEGLYVPALADAASIDRLRGYVVVDEGAVRYVVNGASVMRPGIVEYSDFDADEVVVVREITYRRPIAVGIALVPSKDLAAMAKGPAVKNVHHLRDKAWELLRDEDVQRMISKLIK